MQSFLNRILALEQKVEILDGELSLTKNMRTLLSNEIDKLHQYQCRTCIAIEGLNKNRNENQDYIIKKTEKVLTCNIEFSKKEEIKDLDKCHRIGSPTNGHQQTIVRFKSPRLKFRVYNKKRKI